MVPLRTVRCLRGSQCCKMGHTYAWKNAPSRYQDTIPVILQTRFDIDLPHYILCVININIICWCFSVLRACHSKNMCLMKAFIQLLLLLSTTSVNLNILCVVKALNVNKAFSKGILNTTNLFTVQIAKNIFYSQIAKNIFYICIHIVVNLLM